MKNIKDINDIKYRIIFLCTWLLIMCFQNIFPLHEFKPAFNYKIIGYWPFALFGEFFGSTGIMITAVFLNSLYIWMLAWILDRYKCRLRILLLLPLCVIGCMVWFYRSPRTYDTYIKLVSGNVFHSSVTSWEEYVKDCVIPYSVSGGVLGLYIVLVIAVVHSFAASLYEKKFNKPFKTMWVDICRVCKRILHSEVGATVLGISIIMFIYSCCFWEWPSMIVGGVVANVDYLFGKQSIKSCGMPSNYWSAYGGILKEYYGVDRKQIAACIVTCSQAGYARGYNYFSGKRIKRKFKKDYLFDEAYIFAKKSCEEKREDYKIPAEIYNEIKISEELAKQTSTDLRFGYMFDTPIKLDGKTNPNAMEEYLNSLRDDWMERLELSPAADSAQKLMAILSRGMT